MKMLQGLIACMVFVILAGGCDKCSPGAPSSKRDPAGRNSRVSAPNDEVVHIDGGLDVDRAKALTGKRISICGKAINEAKGLPRIELDDGTGILVSLEQDSWPYSTAGYTVVIVGTVAEISPPPEVIEGGEKLAYQWYTSGAYYLQDCKWDLVCE